MSIGPGKYDDLCTYVREAANAEAALVIILGGKHGSGFSIEGHAGALTQLALVLAEILASVQAEMARDLLELKLQEPMKGETP